MATVKVTLASLIDDGEMDGYRPAPTDRIDDEVCWESVCAFCKSTGADAVGFRRVGSYRAFSVCRACGHCEEF